MEISYLAVFWDDRIKSFYQVGGRRAVLHGQHDGTWARGAFLTKARIALRRRSGEGRAGGGPTIIVNPPPPLENLAVQWDTPKIPYQVTILDSFQQFFNSFSPEQVTPLPSKPQKKAPLHWAL